MPRVLLPSMNETVPLAVPAPLAGLTDALNVTLLPRVGAALDALKTVVVELDVECVLPIRIRLSSR